MQHFDVEEVSYVGTELVVSTWLVLASSFVHCVTFAFMEAGDQYHGASVSLCQTRPDHASRDLAYSRIGARLSLLVGLSRKQPYTVLPCIRVGTPSHLFYGPRKEQPTAAVEVSTPHAAMLPIRPGSSLELPLLSHRICGHSSRVLIVSMGVCAMGETGGVNRRTRALGCRLSVEPEALPAIVSVAPVSGPPVRVAPAAAARPGGAPPPARYSIDTAVPSNAPEVAMGDGNDMFWTALAARGVPVAAAGVRTPRGTGILSHHVPHSCIVSMAEQEEVESYLSILVSLIVSSRQLGSVVSMHQCPSDVIDTLHRIRAPLQE